MQRRSIHRLQRNLLVLRGENNFLPDIGTLKTYRRPQGHGVRVDDGFEQGMDIPFYYDPMIAKLICHAESREAAIKKMIRLIDEYEITGLETTLGFCRFVMNHEAFTSGNFDTRFVENYFRPEVLANSAEGDELIAAALAVTLGNGKGEAIKEVNTIQAPSKWKKKKL